METAKQEQARQEFQTAAAAYWTGQGSKRAYMRAIHRYIDTIPPAEMTGTIEQMGKLTGSKKKKAGAQ